MRDAQFTNTESERKYEDISRKMATLEADAQRGNERAEGAEKKLIELEEELKVVATNLKSLEVAEEKANKREESYKEQIKTLTAKLKQAEARAEFAERSVQKLQKEVRPGPACILCFLRAETNICSYFSCLAPKTLDPFLF